MLSADQIVALRVLADVYVGQGRSKKAVRLLEAVQTLSPGDTEVIKAMSYACLVAGEYERAVETAEAFLDLDTTANGGGPILLIHSRALWALGRHQEAEESLRGYHRSSGSP